MLSQRKSGLRQNFRKLHLKHKLLEQMNQTLSNKWATSVAVEEDCQASVPTQLKELFKIIIITVKLVKLC